MAASVLVGAALIAGAVWVSRDAAQRGSDDSAKELPSGLAAIEQERPYVAEIQSFLRNAAVAMESYAVAQGGQYLGATPESLLTKDYSRRPKA